MQSKTLIFLEWLGENELAFLLNKELKSLSISYHYYINDAFTWNKTPEGYKFWKEINRLWQLEIKKDYNKILYERPSNQLTWLK